MAKKKTNQKIRLLVSWAGLDFSYAPGDIVEVPEEQAKAWIEANAAELVGDDK